MNILTVLKIHLANLTLRQNGKKYFSEKCGLEEPVEVRLGVRYDTRRNRATGTYEQVPVTDKCVYIPLLETLKFIFINKEIFDHILQLCEKTGVYKDFCDGNYFKDHPHQTLSKYRYSTTILKWQTHLDPSMASIRLEVYTFILFTKVLRNLSPKINSALMNIHLLACFHTVAVKKYGFNTILEPLVHDLKVLECTGVEVPFADEPVCGTIAQVTGDNLGLHRLLGYVESFNANYFCHFCLVDKQTSQTVFSDDDPRIMFRN